MLRVPFLRNILVISVFVALGFPFVETFVIQPDYQEALVRESQEEAVRLAQYLMRAARLAEGAGTAEEVRTRLDAEVALFPEDSHLAKLRLYDEHGDITYSSDSSEIGKGALRSSFFEIVAQGQVHSTLVAQGELADGRKGPRVDLVETCVPMFSGNVFKGALEMGMDVSASRQRIHDIAGRSFVVLMFYSLGFLLIVYWVLHRAFCSLEARRLAEKKLLKANQDLESRMGERAEDLQRINRLLVGEIEERTQAQLAMSRALKEAREARMKIDGILKSVLDGLLVTDSEGRVVLLNGAAEKMLGLTAAGALGEYVERLCIDLMLKDRIMAALLDRQCGVQFDFELEGGSKVYRGRTFLLRQKETGDSGMIFLFCDVTRDRELDRMKSEFFSVAAHQINTPLSIILGYAELLQNVEDGQFGEKEKSEYLGHINDSARKLAGVVEDLVDISRVEAGQRLHLDFSLFRLDRMVSGLLERYRQANPTHRFRLESPPSGVEIQADVQRLEQVMENLLSNAVKYAYAFKGGEVLVRLEIHEALCRVSVRDQGVGMLPAQMERVFDKCYRADGPKGGFSGTGLGMSIARHIIEAHQGDIRVQSAPGKGTSFEFILPLSQDDWQIEAALA